MPVQLNTFFENQLNFNHSILIVYCPQSLSLYKCCLLSIETWIGATIPFFGSPNNMKILFVVFDDNSTHSVTIDGQHYQLSLWDTAGGYD